MKSKSSQVRLSFISTSSFFGFYVFQNILRLKKGFFIFGSLMVDQPSLVNKYFVTLHQIKLMSLISHNIPFILNLHGSIKVGHIIFILIWKGYKTCLNFQISLHATSVKMCDVPAKDVKLLALIPIITCFLWPCAYRDTSIALKIGIPSYFLSVYIDKDAKQSNILRISK